MEISSQVVLRPPTQPASDDPVPGTWRVSTVRSHVLGTALPLRCPCRLLSLCGRESRRGLCCTVALCVCGRSLFIGRSVI